MKKALVIAVALFALNTVTNASIFKCWLETTTPNASGYYSVKIYGEILADPNIPGEDLTDSGFSAVGLTVHSPGTVGVTEPRVTGLGVLLTTWGPEVGTWGLKIEAAAQDYAPADGDKDAVEFALGDTSGADISYGTNGAILLATETWKNLKGGTVTLTPVASSDVSHWTPDYARVAFTGFDMVSTTFTLPATAVKPTITLTSPNAIVNTSTKGGLTATGVNFTATKTAGDQSTSGQIGGTAFTTLPATIAKDLTITNGTTNQVITMSATATNAGGTSTAATTNVTVVQAPLIHLLVNGAEATNGQVFGSEEFWGHNLVTLSLANSVGYIQSYTITNPETGLNFTGTNWTGDSYLLYGASVTATVANSGTGLNSDSIAVQFVPEPATMALLAIGAIGTMIRRRK